MSLSKPSVEQRAQGDDPDPVRVGRSGTAFGSRPSIPANGMDVSVTRVVRKNGKVIHSDTYRTHYVLWNGIIQVGR